MFDAVIGIRMAEGFLGGSTESVLGVTIHDDGTVSIQPGTISREHCEETEYWEEGASRISSVEKLRELLPQLSTQLGGCEEVALAKLRELGAKWDHPILSNL